MSFAMFFMAEYINMVTVSAVATNLYLGGWHGPFLPESYGWIWFAIKLAILLFIYLWLRWTLPRFRYDQLMSFGWKVLLPLATVTLLLTAAGVLYFGLCRAAVLHLRDRHGGRRAAGRHAEEPGLQRAVDHRGLLRAGRALRAARGAVRRGGADHHLRRRDHGAVPVRGDAAQRAARGCGGVGSLAPAVSARRGPDRRRA